MRPQTETSTSTPPSCGLLHQRTKQTGDARSTLKPVVRSRWSSMRRPMTETGLRSPLPGWSVANDTPQDIGEGIHPRHTTDATRMQDEGLRSPRLAPDGAKSSSKRSRRVAKMLVRSGLRCHCCFKLKHECEHRKAAILHANYRTLSCISASSFAQVLQDRDHGGSISSHPAAGTLS